MQEPCPSLLPPLPLPPNHQPPTANRQPPPGYVKSYEYLEGEMRARLDLQKDGLYLYRNMVPPHVPSLAFVGSEVRRPQGR